MLFQGGNFLKNDEKKGRKTLTKWKEIEKNNRNTGKKKNRLRTLFDK